MVTSPHNPHHTREQLLTVGIFLLVNVASFLAQDRISHNSGKGWDGVVYYSVAEQFSRGQLPHASAPFVYRIGTPFLASLAPIDNLLDAFWIINILANAVTVFLLSAFFRMHLRDWKIRTLLLALFMFQWHGPVRFVFLYPAYVDSLFFAFLIAGLILLTKLKSRISVGAIILLAIIMFIGAAFREAVLLVALAAPFIENPMDADLLLWKNWRRKIACIRISLLVPLATGFLGLAVTHLLATQTNSYSFLSTAFMWAYEKPLPGYILAWFIAFGPLLAVTVYDVKGCWRFLMREQYLLILLLGYATLGWIGGSDTERIVYWSMPVIYLLTGLAIERHGELLRSVPLVLTLVGLQAVSQRITWATPDYPNGFRHRIPFLTPIGENFPNLDLYSYHGNRLVESVSLLQYALCAVCIVLWLYNRSIKREACANKGIESDK